MSNETHLFAYGTLMLPAMVHQILDREIKAIAGTLLGYACYEVKHQIYPAIVADDGSNVSGMVYQNLTDEDLRKLDEYEGDMYKRSIVEIQIINGKPLTCQTYVCKDEYISLLDDRIWNPSRISPQGLLGLLD